MPRNASVTVYAPEAKCTTTRPPTPIMSYVFTRRIASSYEASGVPGDVPGPASSPVAGST